MAKVVFTPSGKRGEFDSETTVLDAARSLGVDLDSVCGGRAMCGRCQVEPTYGHFAKHGIEAEESSLSPVGDVETRFLQRRQRRIAGAPRRLGCQARILGDLVIDVPPESQVHRQVVRKDADHREIPLATGLHLYFVKVPEARIESPSGDAQRLVTALESDWGLAEVGIDPVLLPKLQQVLRDGDWKVTVAVHEASRIVAAWPGMLNDAFGIAVDIGSTTIAAHLCSLTSGKVVGSGGVMNPQIRFGEDLMSRVSYVQMHPEGAGKLTDSVREGVNRAIGEVSRNAGVEPEQIVSATVVGNPIMHHLFLGISPVELGGAPFALATDDALDLRASELGLTMSPGGNVYILPCIAGHVGADTAGVILAEEPFLQERTTLLVDVGTNAEIVIGNKHGLYACSSPTGPAFEGAQISCGQRAAPGAIERVRIDQETLEVSFRVIGSDLWSHEPGFDHSTGKIGVTGICGSGIIEAIAEMYLASILTEDGVIDGGMSSRSNRVVEDNRTWSFVLHDGENRIIVTQNDVRQVQLAKAALYAGIRLLLDQAGLDSVDRIRLAGAFGSQIDPVYAMVLGLIPDCDLENVASSGNAAGTGARIALLNTRARAEIENVVQRITKIETATEPRFQEHFVNAMAIPNKVDEFPKLFAKVSRPNVTSDAAAAGPTSKRRRARRRTGRSG